MLAVGLVLGLGWTGGVSTSMPGWWDPDEACTLRFGGADSSSVDVGPGGFRRGRAAISGRNVQDFISPTKSAVLSVIGVLILVVLVAGLILTVRRLTGEPGPNEPRTASTSESAGGAS